MLVIKNQSGQIINFMYIFTGCLRSDKATDTIHYLRHPEALA